MPQVLGLCAYLKAKILKWGGGTQFFICYCSKTLNRITVYRLLRPLIMRMEVLYLICSALCMRVYRFFGKWGLFILLGPMVVYSLPVWMLKLLLVDSLMDH